MKKIAGFLVWDHSDDYWCCLSWMLSTCHIIVDGRQTLAEDLLKKACTNLKEKGVQSPPPPLPWKIQTWNWVKTTKKSDLWNSVKAINLPHPGEIEWVPRLLYTKWCIICCISTRQGITCRWRHLLIFKVGYMALTVYRTSEWSCYFWRFAITWRFTMWTTKLTLDNFQWLGLLTSFLN